ncbi:MAG: DUF5812 family protein [Haloarculaceae archaeon]
MTESQQEKTGTFLVTHAEEESAVVRDVVSGQVHTLSENPGVEEGDALEATLAPEPPMEVTWAVVDVDARRTIRVEESAEPPTRQEFDIAADQPEGEITRRERAGTGELHVMTVPSETVEQAVSEVLDDETTRSMAAKLGVDRVEVRSDAEAGVVSVRYLP